MYRRTLLNLCIRTIRRTTCKNVKYYCAEDVIGDYELGRISKMHACVQLTLLCASDELIDKYGPISYADVILEAVRRDDLELTEHFFEKHVSTFSDADLARRRMCVMNMILTNAAKHNSRDIIERFIDLGADCRQGATATAISSGHAHLIPIISQRKHRV